MKTIAELNALVVAAIASLIGKTLTDLVCFETRSGNPDNPDTGDGVATFGLNGNAIDTKLGAELNPGKKPGQIQTIEVWFPSLSRDQLIGRGLNAGAVATIRIDDLAVKIREDAQDPTKRYARVTLRPKAPGAIALTHKAVSGEAMFAE